MPSDGLTSHLPIAATMDLQYRLPPFQQIVFSGPILAAFILLGIGIAVLILLARRARAKAKIESRLEALKMAEKILRKRGGSDEDVERVFAIFNHYPRIDPAATVMIKDNFQNAMAPLLEKAYDKQFAERMERIYFPPINETREAINNQAKDAKALTEEKKAVSPGQAPAAIIDLMDATLRPGTIVNLAFEEVEGGYDCMVMGHDMQSINVTLPANSSQLVAGLKPGLKIEGTMESGTSLIAFTSSVIQAVAGSMPYCRIAAWKAAWEVRKRDSIRLPITVEIDFQHISTAQSETIKISNLDREIGSIRPGRLTDISLGGCCIETPSTAPFRIGDMIRFSKSLVTGNPPATLLGAVVNIDLLDPETSGGAKQGLHVQFLIIDDVSQRILVRTLRHLQDLTERDEWMQAQQLLQKMRRNKIQNIGSPTGQGVKHESTRFYTGPGIRGNTTRPGTTTVQGTGSSRSAAAKRAETVRGTSGGTGPKTRPPTALRKVPANAPTQARPSTGGMPVVQKTRPSTVKRPPVQ